MKRFENAQVGDKVYSRMQGHGVIVRVEPPKPYGIIAQFHDSKNAYSGAYNLDGFYLDWHEEPTLFYSDGENNYLTERPEPETDWSKIPIGTEVEYVADNNVTVDAVFYGYFPGADKPYMVASTYGKVSVVDNLKLRKR